MRRLSSAEVSAIGVAAVGLTVARDLGWVFREQPFEDYGIDAQVEIVQDGTVSGKLLALQIKCGSSWFAEPSGEGWWFRPDAAHVRYWINHSLPVVIVMHHPETGSCHWQLVSQDVLESTPAGGWKMLIPRAHVLDGDAHRPLMNAVTRYESQAADKLLRLANGPRQPEGASGSTWWGAAEAAVILARRHTIADLQALATADGTTETIMHKAIGDNYWIFGSMYVGIALRRDFALLDQHDYPLLHADGSLQIIELKGTRERIVENHRNHYIVADGVHRAVSQCLNYLRALDEQGPTLQTTYRNERGIDIDFRRARGTVVIGHLDRKEASAATAIRSQIEQTIRSYNAHLSRIQVVTYSDLLESADRALRFAATGNG